jgi:hypothetical protein
MGIIKALDEIALEKMNECSEAGAGQFKSSIRPIYGSSRNGTPRHIGTCILLNLNQENYLLTAAHIVDENKFSSLYVGTRSELELIEGEFFITREPVGGRINDHYDFAWKKLSTEFLAKLKNVKFIYEKDLAINLENTDSRLFLALGYPNSKNKKVNLLQKSVTPRFMKYSSTVKPNTDLCKKLGISENQHFFLNFNSKHSKNSDGLIVNSIAPKGISGGALIDMGSFGPKQFEPGIQCKGKLAGMLIENHKEHKAISAIKIGVIINQIRKLT